MTNRDRLRQSLTELDAKNKAIKANPPIVPTKSKGNGKPAKEKSLATVAKTPYEAKIGEKPPVSQRKSKARDARACARGRLPVGTRFTSSMIGPEEWECLMEVPLNPGSPHLKEIRHRAKGLFQCLEELDLLYRKWLAEHQLPSASLTEAEAS